MSVNWQVKHFDELSKEELYALLALRAEVFVVEQNCPYQDLDGKDHHSWHVMGWNENQLVAVGRIVAKGISYPEIAIGRVATKLQFRKLGYGKALMLESIKWIEREKGVQPIRLSAQCYLQDFYEGFGFEAVGNTYLEDGIPHMEMLKN